MKKKILVIANPASGKGEAKKIAPVVRQELIKRKREYKFFITTRPLEASEITRKNKKRGFSDIIVIGGDGTFNEVLNGLGKSKIPLGFICTGSGNDFGRNFFRHMSIKEQIGVALEGRIKKIDVGICNKQYFLNGVGIGFDGRAVEEMMKKGKILKGHWAYLYVVLKQILTYKEPLVTIKIKKEVLQERIFLVAVCNGTSFGGGFKLTPDAKFDDGLFDVCLIKPINILGRYKNLRKVEKGTHTALEFVKMFRTKEIIVESEEEVVAHLDGEFIGPGPFQIKILPLFLNIRIPQ